MGPIDGVAASLSGRESRSLDATPQGQILTPLFSPLLEPDFDGFLDSTLYITLAEPVSLEHLCSEPFFQVL